MRKASEKFSRLTFFTPYDCMTTASTFPLSIGCAAGFSGDRVDAAGPVVDSLIARCAAHPGQRASLIFETLAERTLALAQLLRRADPQPGFEFLLDDLLRLGRGPDHGRQPRLAGEGRE